MKSKLFLMTMFLIFVQFGMNAQNDVTKTSPDVNNTECTDSISPIEKGNFELLIKKIRLSLRDFRWGDDNIYTESKRLPLILIDKGEGIFDFHPIENLNDIDPESVIEIKIEYGRNLSAVYGARGQASGVIKIKLRQEKK